MGKMDNNNLDNRLLREKSPYLQSHASNPVNWYPWGTEAIEKARTQDKPILLSIGYASCHWCHVMMRDTFCDTDIAATMNRLFVNIKVDKEERPDIDKAYQMAYQLLMGQPGGWPLTVFLSPNTLMPYYGGTYFPKEIEEDGISFNDILHQLNEVYYRDKDKIEQQELHIKAILQIMMQFRPATAAPDVEEIYKNADKTLKDEFDPANGGFGAGAKFPNSPCLDFILQADNTMTRHMAISTLTTMAQGGIYDQLAGGFFRYTLDAKWQIPHFEKMLYDNGQLISIYAKAYKLTNDTLFKDIANQTCTWLLDSIFDDKTQAFFTAYDADTEEQEGLYYLWDIETIKEVLNPDEFSYIKKYFHLNDKANFANKWHLSVDANADKPSNELLNTIRKKLLSKRIKRTPPIIDKLILTSCNSLTIKGFNICANIFANAEYDNIVKNSINFFMQKMYKDNILYATWQIDEPKIHGFLDDYAFLLDAILDVIGNNDTHEYLDFCHILARGLIDKFYDVEFGGFFFSAHDSEELIFRPKTFADDSVPSGNGIACLTLIKLGKLTDNKEYIEVARKSVAASYAFLDEAPELHLTMALAFNELSKI